MQFIKCCYLFLYTQLQCKAKRGIHEIRRLLRKEGRCHFLHVRFQLSRQVIRVTVQQPQIYSSTAGILEVFWVSISLIRQAFVTFQGAEGDKNTGIFIVRDLYAAWVMLELNMALDLTNVMICEDGMKS